MGRWSRVAFVLSAVLSSAGLARAEGIAAEVASVDQKARCLSIDWNNNTQKKVCWNDKTKFSVLETGKAAKASDVRKGSYLRIEGEEKDGAFRASEIVIWEEASRPAE
jgi:hypothetical protein